MVDAFDARAYGPLIVLFAAPNVLPVALPGISAVLGAPLILLTAQLMIGRHRPVAARRSCAAARWRARASSALVAPDRAAAQRHRADDPAAAPAADRRLAGKRVIGAVGLILAAIVFLPIPFGNALPGLALVLMAVGLLGRDGIAVLAGGADRARRASRSSRASSTARSWPAARCCGRGWAATVGRSAREARQSSVQTLVLELAAERPSA